MGLINNTNDPRSLSLVDKLKFLFKDIVFFGGLRAISLIFPFLTIPIFTRYFTIEEFGLFDTLVVYISFTSLLIVFGQDSAVARWFYQFEDEQSRRKIISESLLIQLVFAALFLIVVTLFSKAISKAYLSDIYYAKYILLFSIQSVCLFLLNFVINILKWSFDRKNYAVISILGPLILFLSLIISYFLKFDFYTYCLLNTVSTALVSIIGLYLCRKQIVFSTDFVFAKQLFFYGVPLGVISFSGSLMPAIDRQMITSFLGLNELGLYSFGFKIASIVVVVDAIFHMAWGPFSLSIYKEPDSERVYNLVLKVYVILFLLVIMLLLFISPFLIKIIGTQEYLKSIDLIIPLTFVFFIEGIGHITSIGISLSLKSYLDLIPYLCSIALFIFLNWLVLPIYGIIGVAYSLLIVSIIKTLLSTFIAHKVFSIRFKLMEIFIGVFSIIFILGVGNYFFNRTLVLTVALILILCYFWFVLLNRMDKEFIVTTIKSKL